MTATTPITAYIQDLFRLSVAYAFIGFIFTLNTVALSFPVTGDIKPPLLLMVIYYWSIYRPTLLPPWFVFMLGALMDFISGWPVGLSALIYVAVHWLIADQRRFLMSQSFVMIWAGYAFVSVVAAFTQWVVFGLIQWNWTPFSPIWYSVFLGAALFPLFSVLLHLTHKILPHSASDAGLDD